MDEIVSPPCPPLRTRWRALRNSVDQSLGWLEWLEKTLPSTDVTGPLPPLPRLPEPEVFEALGVVQHYALLRALRRARESWDNIIRTYEDSWDSQHATKMRFFLAYQLRQTLNDALASPEVVEARLAAEEERNTSSLIQSLDAVFRTFFSSG